MGQRHPLTCLRATFISAECAPLLHLERLHRPCFLPPHLQPSAFPPSAWHTQISTAGVPTGQRRRRRSSCLPHPSRRAPALPLRHVHSVRSTTCCFQRSSLGVPASDTGSTSSPHAALMSTSGAAGHQVPPCTHTLRPQSSSPRLSRRQTARPTSRPAASSWPPPCMAHARRGRRRTARRQKWCARCAWRPLLLLGSGGGQER